MSRTSGRSGAAAGGTLGLAPCHPQGCKATVGTLFLKRRGRRGLSLEAGGCHHVGLSVPPSGLFLAGALPMAFTTPSGRDRCRGPWQPAGERWVPASSPLWAEGPGQGSLLRWQSGTLGVTGPAVSAGRGRPAVCCPRIPTLTVATHWVITHASPHAESCSLRTLRSGVTDLQANSSDSASAAPQDSGSAARSRTPEAPGSY